jgi:release factor H-coupled RctB family protein
MPDLHPGNRFPIGCSVVADGVYPALIGSDVGCGIALYHIGPAPSRLSPTKLADRLRNLDSAWEGDVAEWLAQYGITRQSSFDASALGTVGGGNHFAELCTIETVVDAETCTTLGLRDTELYLLVHTGSRGLGASILEAHTANESNPYFAPDSEALTSYMIEHDYAVQWAIANRDLVAHRIADCILSNPLDEDGTEILPSGPPSKDTLRKVVDITHNSAVRSNLTIGGEEKDVWIHRKGAAPTDKGVTPCPGSRGDFSWLLMPTGDGQHNAQSLPHGAGRLHPRATLQAQQARRPVARSSLLTTQLGSEVVCTDPALLIEEAPHAYKNIQTVVDDMEWAGCARGVAVLRPVVTYKTREAGERR